MDSVKMRKDSRPPSLKNGNAMIIVEHVAAGSSGPRAMDFQRASEFQAALLGMAGHDLRQPLQVILSAYEWLGSRIGAASDRARLERGERAIARLTEQLDRLVSALRLYEHTRSIDVSRLALGPLLCRIVDENTETAAEKGVELRLCPTTAAVISHPILLDSILRNLLRNAVKYTNRGGRILVGCRRSGEDIRIDVYDTGAGMAPEHLPRIFEAFQRLDTTHPDGLGIGLLVVRRAVELLGHRIMVSSVLNRGSRFSVLAREAR